MIFFLEQKEAIAILKDIKILKQQNYIKILEDKQNKTKSILSSYEIELYKNTWTKITISYKTDIKKDKVIFYSVYLTSYNNKDYLCICKSRNNIFSNLFYNILSLQENNWKYCINGEKPLKTINDYKSVIFESNPVFNMILDNLIFNNLFINKLCELYPAYVNENKLIPIEISKSIIKAHNLTNV